MQKVVMAKPRCKKCGSTQIRVRFSSNEIVCYVCGNVEKKERENESM